MPETRSEAPQAPPSQDSFEHQPPLAYRSPAKGRWLIYSLTVKIGRPDEIAEMNRLHEAAVLARRRRPDRLEELQRRCEQLEEIVDRLTQEVLYGSENHGR